MLKKKRSRKLNYRMRSKKNYKKYCLPFKKKKRIPLFLELKISLSITPILLGLQQHRTLTEFLIKLSK
jgi:hypothetical protein